VNKKRKKNESQSLKTIFQKANKSSDFHQLSPFKERDSILISFYKSLVDTKNKLSDSAEKIFTIQ